DYPFGRINWHSGLGRVPGIRGPLRVFDEAFAELTLHTEVVRAVPVVNPLPRIARHVIKTIAVGRKSTGGQSPNGSTGLGAHNRETALLGIPVIGHLLPVRHKFVAPHISGLLKPTTGGVFPFRLGWQSLAGPFRIGFGIFEAHLYDRVVPLVFYAATRAQGLTPVRAGHIPPPIPVGC